MKRERKQFCIHGHDTFLFGRDSVGRCKICRNEPRRKYKPGQRPKKQFCPNKHDTFVVGRDKNGRCRECTRENRRIWVLNNRNKSKKQIHKWTINNPDKVKNAVLQRKYGITLDIFKAMAAEQGNKCKICEKVEKLMVDHDHKTGKVRGLLCRWCNVRLEVIEDLIFTKNAKKYLKRRYK